MSNMKKKLIILFYVLIFFLACSIVAECVRTPPHKVTVNNEEEEKSAELENQVHTYHKENSGTKREAELEEYPSGSRLPDCSYACGPCSPCKRVMISFKCSVAESCSVVYRCTCNGRYYHVPSRA